MEDSKKNKQLTECKKYVPLVSDDLSADGNSMSDGN